MDTYTGEGLLAWRVNLVPPFGSGETLGFARGPSFRGLFKTLAEPLMPGLAGYEDPFLWAHKEATPDGWELILSIIEHTQTRETGVGGLFVSENGGVSWRKSPLPVYTLAVQMTGPGWNETSTPTQASSRRRVALNTHAYAPFSLSSCGENAPNFCLMQRQECPHIF